MSLPEAVASGPAAQTPDAVHPLRVALGADPADVVRLVLLRVGWLVTGGIVLGIFLSWWSVRLVEQLLFGLEARDPLTFALVILVLGVTSLVAIAGPAWKATRVDPVVALRTE